jgi:hypothetical protein
MKRSLLVAISLLSSTNFSLGMLDDPFVQDAHRKVLPVKNSEDFRSKNPIYQGISNLHPGQPPYFPGANYPKVPLIRPYYNYWNNLTVPFVASLHKAHAPSVLENIHSQQLPNHTKVYSFVVQSMQDENEGETVKLHRVVPHYFVHPDAPAHFKGRNYVTNLKWTAAPGGKGHVTPANANHQHMQLLPDSISTHNHATGVMLTSADVMHLQGLYHQHSVDLTSLVAFTDEKNNNISAITYHWLLNNEDLNVFNIAITNAKTFRELINGLEPLGNFKNLVGELKRYVDFSGEKAVRAQVKVPIKLLTDWTPTGLIKTDRIPVKGGDAITVTCNFSEVKEPTQVKFINTAQNKYYDGGVVVNPGTKAARFTSIVPEGDTHTWLQFHNLGWNNTPHQIGFSIQDIKIEKALPIKLLTDWTKTGLIKTDKLSVKGGDKITVTCQFSEIKELTQVHFINTAQNKYYEGGVLVKPGMKVAQFTSTVPEGDTHTWLQFHNVGWNNTPHPIGFSIQDVQINLEEAVIGREHLG